VVFRRRFQRALQRAETLALPESAAGGCRRRREADSCGRSGDAPRRKKRAVGEGARRDAAGDAGGATARSGATTQAEAAAGNAAEASASPAVAALARLALLPPLLRGSGF
jgi:hypothetical protein